MSPIDSTSPSEQEPPRPRSIARGWKLLISAGLLYHLAAIALAPASISPSSPLIRQGWRGVGTYLQALNLNHGSHFFAPDPGPSTLVRYVVELPDGRTVTGQIPNKQTMWPRLLYHRHFMLTELLASSEFMDPRIQPLHIRALARQIANAHDAEAVSLSRITHLLADPQWCRSGLPLDDPELYEEEAIGRFERGDF